jgi:glycine/D-amino acid oxidase-like deaminating enzyme
VTTSRPPETLSRVVHAPGVHLRPDASGRLLLGADDVDTLATPAVGTSIPSGAVPFNAEGAARLSELAALLVERAARVFREARHVKVVEHRMGVRPMPADGHTIAGRIPGSANAWVIATHSGVTLGPLLGRLLADEVIGGTPDVGLAPFRPERFLTTGAAAR